VKTPTQGGSAIFQGEHQARRKMGWFDKKSNPAILRNLLCKNLTKREK
jgi:hypothetical protein